MNGIEGNNGYYIRSSGARVAELLSRHFIVPTIDSAPTEDTTSWQDGDYVVDFRIGEFVRVHNGDEYLFYRLKDLNDGKAFWAEATSSDMSDYYTKQEIDRKLSQIIISGGGGGVEVLSSSQYEEKVNSGAIVDNMMYFIVENDEPFELYIGHFLIGKKGDVGNIGFPYSFPITF